MRTFSSVGTHLLGNAAPSLVGLGQEATCFVSAEYFAEQDPHGNCAMVSFFEMSQHDCERQSDEVCLARIRRARRRRLNNTRSRLRVFGVSREGYSPNLRGSSNSSWLTGYHSPSRNLRVCRGIYYEDTRNSLRSSPRHRTN